MQKAYLYDRDGSPVMEADWHCGRFLGRSHATTYLERTVAEGDTRELHAGHGVWHEYRVAAADERTALLVRT